MMIFSTENIILIKILMHPNDPLTDNVTLDLKIMCLLLLSESSYTSFWQERSGHLAVKINNANDYS